MVLLAAGNNLILLFTFILLSSNTTAVVAHLCPDLLSASHANAIGQLQTRTIDSETRTIETMSLHPPIWRVQNFLTEQESQWYINEMNKVQGVASTTVNDGTIEHLDYTEVWSDFQVKENTKLTIRQLHFYFSDLLDMPGLTVEDASKLLAAIDINQDHMIDPNEWGNQDNWRKVEQIANTFHLTAPEKFTRYSRTYTDISNPLKITKRIASLLGVPKSVLDVWTRNDTYQAVNNNNNNKALLGETVQLVEYEKHGHYACHHDSQDDKNGMKRSFTVLLYLEDVAKGAGGETWFPGSGLDPKGDWDHQDWEELEIDCRMHSQCPSASSTTQAGGGEYHRRHRHRGLVIPSVRGTAVVWMNHRSSDPTKKDISGPWGEEGEEVWQKLDWSTVHAGCDVKEGKKYLANQWVSRLAIEQLCDIQGDFRVINTPIHNIEEEL